ncbi:MAG TPA: methylated-DNA--[protein]-cysteine S-methyltransferase [Jatrophihabitans sp.]|jgi:methylated-DNA-[protein]-cysteine S-methyltransferase
MTETFTYIDSPLGALLVTRDEDGITGLHLPTGAHAELPPPDGERDDAAFEDVRAQLAEYFAGERTDFELPLHPAGTDFQRRCWTALRTIEYGTTASYGEQAVRIGNAKAVRAVGLANGQNPISIIVPCHRVIGANGSLTGYGGGLPAKQWLLSHEAAHSGLFAS